MELQQQRTTTVVDVEGGGRQQHARLGGRLRWGWMREGGEKWQRQRIGDDGCGSGRRRRQTTTARADNDRNGSQSHGRLGGRLDGEGQKQAAREGGDSGVAMMTMAAEDGGGRQ